MSPARIFALTTLSMLAFAGNSLLCRLALQQSQLDAGSFTSIRLVSGALVLWLVARKFRGDQTGAATGRRLGRSLFMQPRFRLPTCVCPRRPARCCFSVPFRPR